MSNHDIVIIFNTLLTKHYTSLSHKSSFPFRTNQSSEYFRILQNPSFEFTFKNRAPWSEFTPSISFEYCFLLSDHACRFPLSDHPNLVSSERVQVFTNFPTNLGDKLCQLE